MPPSGKVVHISPFGQDAWKGTLEIIENLGLVYHNQLFLSQKGGGQWLT